MSAPLIGITSNRQIHFQGFTLFCLAQAYIQAVSQAGGIPVVIPLGLPEDQLKSLFSRLDGILFSGGGDVDPERYGAYSHPEVGGVDDDRDRVEYQLILDSVRKDLPFLGICRGIQVINAALGGTLYTHIPEQLPDAIPHVYIEGNPRDYLAHEVLVQQGTRLAGILGQPSLKVNSMHHQGIADLASGFLPSAHAPDGLIEGIELPEHRFGFGVQWHPEWLTAHKPMRALFRAFVEAAAL